MKQIIVFTVPKCSPCSALKEALTLRNIEYLEISARGLKHLDRTAFLSVLNNIAAVTKCIVDGKPDPSFPAVCIVSNNDRIWISNDGLVDIGGMLEKIESVLNEKI